MLCRHCSWACVNVLHPAAEETLTCKGDTAQNMGTWWIIRANSETVPDSLGIRSWRQNAKGIWHGLQFGTQITHSHILNKLAKLMWCVNLAVQRVLTLCTQHVFILIVIMCSFCYYVLLLCLHYAIMLLCVDLLYCIQRVLTFWTELPKTLARQPQTWHRSLTSPLLCLQSTSNTSVLCFGIGRLLPHCYVSNRPATHLCCVLA